MTNETFVTGAHHTEAEGYDTGAVIGEAVDTSVQLATKVV